MYLGMKKIFIPLAVTAITLGLASCNSCSDTKNENHEGSAAKGGVYLGGIMRLNEIEAFKSLNPISVNEISGFHLGTQLFEGLVKFDQKDLSILPAISNRWESNENQTEWTFHIRQGVKFHNDACFKDGKGRTVTANDIKFCFDKLCTSDPTNTQFGVTFKDRVVGANEAVESS